ncbi:hypothetical protein MWU59_07925 [Flavobacteriaceae bacterium F08102]|nr:hypothetical protein [Flavobacteriaceae bacterium F08102]
MKKIILFFSFPLWCFGQGGYNFTKIDSIGIAIEKTINAEDKTFINQLFDVEAFVDRFVMSSSNEWVLEYNSAFIKAFTSAFDLGETLINQGEYSYMRLYMDADHKFHLLFRLFSDVGVNYHDYLVHYIDGTYKLVDVYVFYTGRNLSDTYRERYMENLAQQDFFTLTKEAKKANKAYEKYLRFIEKEQYKKAYLSSFKVSPKRQKTKAFKLLQVNVAKQLEGTVLTEVLADFEASFPNDPSLALRMIDYYFENKQYDACLACVEVVDKAVNGDYFLDIYRGNICEVKGDLAKAKGYFQSVIDNFPNFLEAYDSLFGVYVKLKNNEEAIQILNIMMTHFGYTKSQLIAYILDQYPNFTQTTAYQAWQ